MAENELDGFENLDDLFGDESGGGGDEAATVSEGIDDLLGESAGAEAGAEGGTSDSELDSFFEDLSTIDDLEMTQEEAPPEEPPPVAAPEPTPPPAAAPVAKPAKKEKKKGGFFKTLIKLLVLLGILGGAGYAFYYYFFPSDKVPWEVSEVKEFEEEPVVEEKPPPSPPQPEPQAVRPAPTPPPPAVPGVSYGIQVATCFFPSCVQEFRKRLKRQNLSTVVKEKTRTRETLEVYSKTTFDDRGQAEALAERINRENRMEGQAYVLKEKNAYRISMGDFTDLARANVVKDALNQRLQGQALFTTRIRQLPYKLHYVVAGRFPSRRAAQQARRRLVGADTHFSDSFVVRN